MKKLSMQWRITLMTLLICATCVLMNLLLCYSGMRWYRIRWGILPPAGNYVTRYEKTTTARPPALTRHSWSSAMSLPS